MKRFLFLVSELHDPVVMKGYSFYYFTTKKSFLRRNSIREKVVSDLPSSDKKTTYTEYVRYVKDIQWFVLIF